MAIVDPKSKNNPSLTMVSGELWIITSGRTAYPSPTQKMRHKSYPDLAWDKTMSTKIFHRYCTCVGIIVGSLSGSDPLFYDRDSLQRTLEYTSQVFRYSGSHGKCGRGNVDLRSVVVTVHSSLSKQIFRGSREL